jgi:uncharacterized oligopeptide transporter (OPT) family protein
VELLLPWVRALIYLQNLIAVWKLICAGMYNVPSFTLARAIGGFINWYHKSYKRQEETPMVVLASGLILGEGVVSIVNLLLASVKVPHF